MVRGFIILRLECTGACRGGKYFLCANVKIKDGNMKGVLEIRISNSRFILSNINLCLHEKIDNQFTIYFL